MAERIPAVAAAPRPAARRRWPASLRRRFAVWFGLLVVVGAVAIRGLHYRATVALLSRDIDVQLWSRLGALKAQERFAAETLRDGKFRLDEFFLPGMPAGGWTAAHAVGLVQPASGRIAAAGEFPWFAGVWRRDGAPVDALDLPADLVWEDAWATRLDTLWTSPDRRHRLAATAGAHDTVIVAGAPLSALDRARARTLLEQALTFAVWMPVVLGGSWWLLSRLLRPLQGIAATAAQIRAGRFDERIDVASADSEISALAATLNEMLDRLDEVRVAQSRFNSNVAHQILNPVHGILLEADLSPPRPRDGAALVGAIGRMAALASRIESLCEALLTFSRSAAIQPERLGRIDLEPVVAGAIDQVLPQALARGISIEAAGSAIVRGDETLLHEALVNLLANAVRHSPEAGRIEVVLEETPAAVRVRVVDHGSGVPPEQTARLFERFHTAGAGGGHGIGLALCRSVVRAHGGDIGHAPTPGGGATFTVELPRPAAGVRGPQARKGLLPGPAVGASRADP